MFLSTFTRQPKGDKILSAVIAVTADIAVSAVIAVNGKRDDEKRVA